MPRRGIARSIVRVQCEMHDGGIIRVAKGREVSRSFSPARIRRRWRWILDELRKHGGKGSFFLTGDFPRNPQFAALVTRITDEGHYLGPHSDKHLLYCSWENPRSTLVTEEQFTVDLFTI